MDTRVVRGTSAEGSRGNDGCVGTGKGVTVFFFQGKPPSPDPPRPSPEPSAGTCNVPARAARKEGGAVGQKRVGGGVA